MFRVVLSKELVIGQKIIVPVSLNSKYFTPEKMQSLVTLLEKHNAVLLIADSLQKHNCGSEKKAIKLGNSFLEKCARFLKNVIQINSLEKWENYKNENVLKIVRWEIWANIKKKELLQGHEIIETDLQSETDLYLSMIAVANQLVEKSIINIKAKSNNQKDIDAFKNKLKSNSVEYQKEEIKFIFSFLEFDVHLYPEINPSQNLAFEKYGENFKLPSRVSFSLQPNTNLFFLPERKEPSACNTLSLAGRTLALHFQAFITSPEVNINEKVTLINFLNAQLERTFDKDQADNYENSFVTRFQLTH